MNEFPNQANQHAAAYGHFGHTPIPLAAGHTDIATLRRMAAERLTMVELQLAKVPALTREAEDLRALLALEIQTP